MKQISVFSSSHRCFDRDQQLPLYKAIAQDIAGHGTAGETKGDTRTALPIPAGDSYYKNYSSDQAAIANLSAWGSALWVKGKHCSPRSKAAGKEALLICHLWHCRAWCDAEHNEVMLLAIHGHFYPYFTCFFFHSPTCLALPHSKPLLLGVYRREQSVSITMAALHLCW